MSNQRFKTILLLFSFFAPLILAYSIISPLFFPWPIIFGFIEVFLVLTLLLANLKIGIFTAIILRSHLEAAYTSLRDLYGPLAALNPAGALGIGVLLFGCLYYLVKKPRLAQIPLLKVWLLFLTVSFASIYFSIDKKNSLVEWIRLANIFVFYCLTFLVLKETKNRNFLLSAWLISAFIPTVVGFYQYITVSGNTEIAPGFNRIFATFAGNANLYSFYLLMIIPALTIWAFSFQSLAKRSLLFFFVLTQVALLALTYTRGAYLGLIVEFLILATLKYRRFFLIVPLALIIIFLFFPSTYQRIKPSASQEIYESLQWRIGYWEKTKDLFYQSPILGNGIGVFKSTVQRYVELPFYQDPEMAHNDYLRLTVETGILGLLVYLGMLGSLTIQVSRWYRAEPSGFNKDLILGFLATLGAYALISAGDNILRFTTVQWHFWSYVALVATIGRASGQQKLSDPIYPSPPKAPEESGLETNPHIPH